MEAKYKTSSTCTGNCIHAHTCTYIAQHKACIHCTHTNVCIIRVQCTLGDIRVLGYDHNHHAHMCITLTRTDAVHSIHTAVLSVTVHLII